MGEWLGVRLPPGSKVLDPCAGRGALSMFMASRGWRWRSIEIRKDLADDIDRRGHDAITVGDALKVPWPSTHCVVANPPYGKALEAFVNAMWLHSRRHKVICACLMRATWFGEGDRAERWRPDCLMWIRGRVSFTGDGKADSSTHVWAIWDSLPCPETRVQWVEQGSPTGPQRAAWRRMLGLEGAQLDLLGEAS